MQVEKRPEPEFDQEIISSLPEKKKKPLPKSVFIGAVVVVVLVGLWAVAYQIPVTNPIHRAVVSVVPFPAARVNGDFITLREFGDEYNALKTYLSTETEETSSVPTTDVMQQTILDSLVNKLAIVQLAEQKGVELDEVRVEQFYQEALKTAESEEIFLKELDETFGWTKEEFQERIIRSIVLALQMTEQVLADSSVQAPIKAQIEEELKSPGTIPEQDFGFVPVENLPEGWEQVGALEIGVSSGLIETQTEYAMVKVADRQTQDGLEAVQLIGVIVPKVTLEDVVQEYLAQAKVQYYLK